MEKAVFPLYFPPLKSSFRLKCVLIRFKYSLMRTNAYLSALKRITFKNAISVLVYRESQIFPFFIHLISILSILLTLLRSHINPQVRQTKTTTIVNFISKIRILASHMPFGTNPPQFLLPLPMVNDNALKAALKFPFR